MKTLRDVLDQHVDNYFTAAEELNMAIADANATRMEACADKMRRILFELSLTASSLQRRAKKP